MFIKKTKNRTVKVEPIELKSWIHPWSRREIILYFCSAPSMVTYITFYVKVKCTCYSIFFDISSAICLYVELLNNNSRIFASDVLGIYMLCMWDVYSSYGLLFLLLLCVRITCIFSIFLHLMNSEFIWGSIRNNLSLPPKIGVRSAYTLPSPGSTRRITLYMLLSFLSIWSTNFVFYLSSRLQFAKQIKDDELTGSFYSITAKTFSKIYFYVVSVSPHRLWLMRNVDVSLFKELSYAQGSFSYHVTNGSWGKYGAISWGPRYFIDTQS